MLKQPRDVDAVFRALADASRRAIVDRLARHPHTISELAAPMSITLAAVSQHVQVLESSGLVRTDKVGRTRTCRLDPAGLSQVERWISSRQRTVARRLDRLADIVRDEQRGEHQ
jgi:DNA-binding transcriptional ArsR family regulator